MEHALHMCVTVTFISNFIGMNYTIKKYDSMKIATVLLLFPCAH